VAYYSRRLTGAEYNYPIHDKEILAIISYNPDYKTILNTNYSILSDYKVLNYFITKRPFIGKQSREASELALFNDIFKYWRLTKNFAADTLSYYE
ncbi:hypothetical protein ACRALDRAFT_2095117, partial [Sodiomyces alcalophilus JCM 7366]|uniref:uncharacterized protein n=1 Tax=Sodiomyces alcalophilus JCM 7366 TaxID=591952 RepID=UPI0039B45E99